MSLLRKSETKQTEMKKVSTPPKYLQKMSNNKGVRSTSYIHRTFVDAEVKKGGKLTQKEKDHSFAPSEALQKDGSYKLEDNEQGASRKNPFAYAQDGFDMLKRFAQELLGSFDKEEEKKLIYFGYYWAKANNTGQAKKYAIFSNSEGNLDNMIQASALQPRAKWLPEKIDGREQFFLFDSSWEAEEEVNVVNVANVTKEELKENKDDGGLFGRSFSGGKALSTDSDPGETKNGDAETRQKDDDFGGNEEEEEEKEEESLFEEIFEMRTVRDKQEYYVKFTSEATPFWESETELIKDGYREEIRLFKEKIRKKKFLAFYDIAIHIRPQKLDELSLKANRDVKKMLKDVKRMLNKSGPLTTSLLLKGKQQGISTDTNEDNFLTTTELRKAIKNDENLKQLFKIGKTGQVDENEEPLVGWKTWFQSMDKNDDNRYSIQEFAKSYLAFSLKNDVRDRLINGDYAYETFDRMVALFGIAEPSKPVTSMDNLQETKEELPVDTRSTPVVTPKFKKGDIVRSKANMINTTRGLIVKIINKTLAHVYWEDGSDEEDNNLTDLELVTIVNEKKINYIFDSYNINDDDKLSEGEDLKSLQENVSPVRVFKLKDKFNVDGIAGFSREEFRFLLTVRTEFIENWDRRKEKEGGERKSGEQRIRNSGEAGTAALEAETAGEEAVEAALAAKQDNDNKIIVNLSDGIFSLENTLKLKKYEKTLETIPPNTCRPNDNNNN